MVTTQTMICPMRPGPRVRSILDRREPLVSCFLHMNVSASECLSSCLVPYLRITHIISVYIYI